jgi:hypothetical protein
VIAHDGGVTVRIDHLVVAVDDLEGATAAFAERTGLAVVPGGQHPWGTANVLVPLGDAYLELAAVTDPDAARGTPFGDLMLGALARGGGVCAWCTELDDLDETAARAGLAVEAGARERADGSTLRWRSAGMRAAAADPALPFLIAWGDPRDRPGALPPARLHAPWPVELQVGTTAVALAARCGGVPPGVEVVAGRGIVAARIRTAGRIVALPCCPAPTT